MAIDCSHGLMQCFLDEFEPKRFRQCANAAASEGGVSLLAWPGHAHSIRFAEPPAAKAESRKSFVALRQPPLTGWVGGEGMKDEEKRFLNPER
jgi:hypothetical protein